MKELNQILNSIENANGKCYFVGGSVRDKLLNIEVYDYDIEVYNISLKDLSDVLQKFGELVVNEKFQTIKLKQYPNYEFAIPRTEVSIGSFHTDFEVKAIEGFDFKTAALRRDFTVNSIMIEYQTGTIIDVFNGREDLEKKRLKHISNKFSEDPLRILRAIRFASKLGFEIEDSTLAQCIEMTNDLDAISNERFSKEFKSIIQGKCSEFGLKYFLIILRKYFKLENYDENKIYKLSSCKNYRIRQVMLFYCLKANNLEFMISRCINERNDLKDIAILLESNLYSSDDFYNLAKYFNKEEIILIYSYLTDINAEKLYKSYEKLKNKYNSTYFIDLGCEKTEISEKMRQNIVNNLEIL